jgi:ribosomal protein S18 acetylase RimI-like enzyme
MTTSPSPPACTLPAALTTQGYRLRPETDDDIPFLTWLYASTREEELAAVPWSAAQKQAFLQSQFEAQRHHYRTNIDGCAFDLLERNGAPGGRLYLNRRQTCLHIVDISLIPAWRRRGLGTAILQALQENARAAGGKSVTIFVEKFNPALRLYRRLGFTEIDDCGVYLEMEWLPEALADTA